MIVVPAANSPVPVPGVVNMNPPISNPPIGSHVIVVPDELQF